MKILTLLIAFVVPALLAAATFVPEAAPYARELVLAAIAASVLVFVLVAALPGTTAEARPARAQAPQPAPPPPAAAPRAEAEIATFVGLLQDKGRFVDFVMEDITGYDDRKVGQVARVVHAGCRAVLDEHLDLRPVRTEEEGSPVTVEAGYAADEYRLVGKIGGAAPFRGTLVHRGWRAESVKLPRVLKVQGDRLPTVAPAEVELR